MSTKVRLHRTQEHLWKLINEDEFLFGKLSILQKISKIVTMSPSKKRYQKKNLDNSNLEWHSEMSFYKNPIE
jgi:hypothetical protein